MPRTLIVLACLSAAVAQAAEFHVTPAGTAGSAGSLAQPWSLAFALSQPAAVHAGDTIWLHGGTYAGRFTSDLHGTATAPIIVRQCPGERATLDGGTGSAADILLIRGGYAWFWGFEIMSSDTNRATTQTGSWPTDILRGGGVNVGNNPGEGVGVKLINLVVHDTAQALSLWRYATDLEASGNILYHNGWNAPDRGHGHGIYTQNETGTKRIADNLVFGGFCYGMQAYGSDSAYVDHYVVDGNTFANSGELSGSGGNLLIGGGRPSRDIVAQDNVAYRRQLGEDGIGIGYNWVSGPNVDAVVRGNYIVGELRVTNYQQAVVRDNTVIAAETVVRLDTTKLASVPAYDWNANTYFCPELQWQPFGLYTTAGNKGPFFPEWKTLTGFDATSGYTKAYPGAAKVIVRPNAYEAGRANITIVNWPRLASVPVDAAGVLAAGDSFEVRDAQNFFAAPVLTGTYTGAALAIPMNQTAVAQPIGGSPHPYVPTAPHFGMFVLLKTGAAPTAPTPPPVAPPTTTGTTTTGTTGTTGGTGTTGTTSTTRQSGSPRRGCGTGASLALALLILAWRSRRPI